jgi:hydroxyethylthiazole kinase-like uncharacterized protein yjeF
VKPVVTAAEMRAADGAAMRTVTRDALVERAGLATAVEATRMLRRTYGAKVAVVCGPGSNGADGTVAAGHLTRRGAAVELFDATSLPARLEGFALVVDAAFGTGLSRRFDAPEVDASVPILAVDLPSGVDPDSGIASGQSLRATRTVAMGARKRGHLLADGAELSGSVRVAPIGIEVVDAEAWLVEDADLALVPPLTRTDHKWRRSVLVLAGSPGVLGAAGLACDGALGVQAGMVLLCVPDVSPGHEGPWPPEVVRLAASADDAEKVVLDALARARALVMGPGLGRSATLQRTVTELLGATREPVVLDADALHLVDPDTLLARQSRGGSPVVLTPHDGEFAAMFGSPPGTDRFAAARDAAARTGCTVVLKGATTVVATSSPPGDLPTMLAVDAGTPDLATPGTGDVLAGIIGGLLARGVPAHLAGALGAHVHGRAGASLGARCRATLLADAVSSFLEANAAPRGASYAS